MIKNYNALEVPNYSLVEAARYFHIPSSTVSYWAAAPDPLIHLASRRPTGLSFKNLVEFYAIEGLRRYGVSITNVRRALKDLLEHEESRHPFADYQVMTDKKYVLFRRNGRILNASLSGQFEMAPLIGAYLRRIQRTPSGIAERLYPYTKEEQFAEEAESPKTVVIDPLVCFGLPVLANSRITSSCLVSRFRGGDSVPAIAKSYGRSVAEIKEAIEWELGKEVRAA